MKAVLWTKYGSPDFLKMDEVSKPLPSQDELLVKVKGATVMPGDCEIRRFDIHPLFWLPLRLYMGLFKPKRPILGMELSGIITEVGGNVSHLKKGDEIIADAGLKFGAYAAYTCIHKGNAMALKPSNLTFEEAATIPTAGMNALHYMRKAQIRPGQKVLIKGASGCFGTYAIQIAKHFGAEVTGVDHGSKLAILQTHGVAHTIDYTKEDYTQNGIRYDAIFDVVGDTSISNGMKSLNDGGRYLLATPWIKRVLEGLWASAKSNKQFIFALAKYKNEDLEYLTGLVQNGVIKPVVDKNYQLEQMSEAHTYVEKGQKIGNVTISV